MPFGGTISPGQKEVRVVRRWYFDLATAAGVPGERLISSPSDVGGFVQFGTFERSTTLINLSNFFFHFLGYSQA